MAWFPRRRRGGCMRWAGLSSGIAFRYLAVISLSERVAGPGGDTPELSCCIRRTRRPHVLVSPEPFDVSLPSDVHHTPLTFVHVKPPASQLPCVKPSYTLYVWIIYVTSDDMEKSMVTVCLLSNPPN
ncbi:hypothetical protein B5X24_HaOG216299 [Helicoverpa armigera]|nr:hypothetical protein B5X24_HaOG216299 [Helicoverpa armigera]